MSTLLEASEEARFNAACKAAAAKLLGVDKVRVVWPDSSAWNKYNEADEESQDDFEGYKNAKTVTVSVVDVLGDDIEEYDEQGEETLTLLGNIVKGEYNDYGGGDDPHYYVPVKAKKIKEDVLAEKVVTLKNPAIKPKGAPEDKARAFDKVHGTTGKRPDRSVLKALSRDGKYHSVEGSNEGDYMQVLVIGGNVPEIDLFRKYYGVNVLFMADGKVTATTGDSIAQGQWRKDREQIIAAARKHWKAGTIEAFVERGGDADLRADDDFDNGHNGYTANPETHRVNSDYHGYFDKKTNEGKLTFKAFLLREAKKIKEPGWYVCDHMDKPVSGPMQERGAREKAEEKNAAHAKKHGKGDIPPFSAEYFSDYEIKRMNEASDAKRLDKQNVEAILKAKKLAALTESAELSTAQKKALLADFEQWSGGYTPDEVPWEGDDVDEMSVSQYIEHGISTKLPKEAAIAYLKHIADGVNENLGGRERSVTSGPNGGDHEHHFEQGEHHAAEAKKLSRSAMVSQRQAGEAHEAASNAHHNASEHLKTGSVKQAQEFANEANKQAMKATNLRGGAGTAPIPTRRGK